MNLNETILNKIQDLRENYSSGVTSIAFGHKTKNGEKTGEIGIVFSVEKKKPINNLSSDEILPKSIHIDGHEFVSDVVELPRLKTMVCYSAGSPEITKLQNLPTVPVALKGGQQIRQFPTSWINYGGGVVGFQVGTLGFFAKDSIDGKVVAVTNAHVACFRKTLASDRNISEESLSPNNTGEQAQWAIDGNMYFPGGSFRNNGNNIRAMHRIKRYEPQSRTGINYVDAAILIPEPAYVDANSYQMWQPTTEPIYPVSLPFATTSELNNLLATNPKVFSTGATTGPKGWGVSSGCIIRVNAIGASAAVADSTEGWTANWADMIFVQNEDGSAGPIGSGDSGSVALAEIGGVKKIIGLVFASGTNIGALCRIDRIASALQISQFTTPLDTTIPTPNFFSSSDFSTYGSQKTIIRNGKTYYQIGITTQNYNS